jgi:FSR family fosmidomycin resistance protein-like MFS transporter
VMGICAGFYHPSAIATVTTHFSAKQRGRVVALHMIGGSLGFGIGPLLGALISRYSSWHLAYIILGVPALVAAFLVLTKLKLPGQNIKSKDTIPSQADGQKRIGVWQVFKPAVSIVAVSVTMQLVTGPVVSFASLYMVDVHHLSAAAGSMWVSLIRLGGMAGSLCGGWLSDKWGRKNTVFLSLLLYGPVVFLVAKLPLGIAFGAAFIILGGLMSMRETTMQAYLMDNTPPELRATVIGIYFGFGQEGSSIVQPIAGNLMDNIGIRGVYNAISMITLFMSAIVVLLIFRNARQNRISGGIPKSE